MMEPVALNIMWRLAIKRESISGPEMFTGKIPRITFEKVGERFYIVENTFFFNVSSLGDIITNFLKDWLLDRPVF